MNRNGLTNMSSVIITGFMVSLIIGVGVFASQIVDYERRASELNSIEKSFILLGDGVESTCWSDDASYTVNFHVELGFISFESVKQTISIKMDGGDPINLYQEETGIVRHYIRGVNLPLGYLKFIEGESNPISTQNLKLSRIWVERLENYTVTTLDFKALVMHVPNTTVNGENADLVKIWLINLNISNTASTGDIYLKVVSLEDSSTMYGPYDANSFIEVIYSTGLLQNGSVIFNLSSSRVYVQVILGRAVIGV